MLVLCMYCYHQSSLKQRHAFALVVAAICDTVLSDMNTKTHSVLICSCGENPHRNEIPTYLLARKMFISVLNFYFVNNGYSLFLAVFNALQVHVLTGIKRSILVPLYVYVKIICMTLQRLTHLYKLCFVQFIDLLNCYTLKKCLHHSILF